MKPKYIEANEELLTEKIEGLISPKKAKTVGRIIIALLLVTQLVVAPIIEQIGTYILMFTIPLTLGLALCFCKSHPVSHVLFWLNIGCWSFVITPALVFLIPLAAMQINWYRHWKRGLAT